MYSILFVSRILTGICYCYGIMREFQRGSPSGIVLR